jgi:hypothetical protein
MQLYCDKVRSISIRASLDRVSDPIFPNVPIQTVLLDTSGDALIALCRPILPSVDGCMEREVASLENRELDLRREWGRDVFSWLNARSFAGPSENGRKNDTARTLSMSQLLDVDYVNARCGCRDPDDQMLNDRECLNVR